MLAYLMARTLGLPICAQPQGPSKLWFWFQKKSFLQLAEMDDDKPKEYPQPRKSSSERWEEKDIDLDQRLQMDQASTQAPPQASSCGGCLEWFGRWLRSVCCIWTAPDSLWVAYRSLVFSLFFTLVLNLKQSQMNVWYCMIAFRFFVHTLLSGVSLCLAASKIEKCDQITLETSLHSGIFTPAGRAGCGLGECGSLTHEFLRHPLDFSSFQKEQADILCFLGC